MEKIEIKRAITRFWACNACNKSIEDEKIHEIRVGNMLVLLCTDCANKLSDRLQEYLDKEGE